ncbi:MAG: histidinolphosphatase [Pycnora praestabilis]|nr:MAG: histidinolphosphatase [Pycnora praestabilis]
MPFSHHSHSGQFCPGHAKNTLEEVVRTAIERKMDAFALTEHMPRGREDFYPEERETGETPATLLARHNAFYEEAVRLREVYASQIKILIGFEIDWIRPSSRAFVEKLLGEHDFNLFVGSVHHVHTIPIDYDMAMYHQARDIAGGTDEKLFKDYFDAQYAMLVALKPPVVGHFDLIRLKSDHPDGSFRRWEGVWQKIERNLKFVVGYGGLLELNSASLRKGMKEPYPKQEICEAFLEIGGRFTLSDDSHGIDQVAFGYDKVLKFIEQTGISALHYLECGDAVFDTRFPHTSVSAIKLPDIRSHQFWT